MSKQMIIPEKPADQRVWVIRAQGGNYVQHFRSGGVVAIGHINRFYFDTSDDKLFFPNLYDIKRKFLLGIEKNEKRKALNHFSQTKNFLAQISIGDLVVTIDGGLLMVGRITGHPYIDENPVQIYDEDTDSYSKMNFKLRRNVEWGPIMERATLPLAMKRSISAWQTVFNIDHYWEHLYHLLYPTFKFEDTIYFSSRINQQENINNYSVGLLFNLLTEIEVITESYKLIAEHSDIDFSTLLYEHIGIDNLNLVSTAEFMSPGSVWSKLGFSEDAGRKIAIGAMLYGAVFGVDLGVMSIDGIVHKEVREKIVSYVLDRLDQHNIEIMKEQLKLKAPNFNTAPLEDSTKDSLSDPRAQQLYDLSIEM